jgi:nitroreductase
MKPGANVLRELILKNRSYRRFDQDKRIDPNQLEELIDLARLSPSAANLQPLKFVITTEPGQTEQIFPALAWAGYLKDWPGPPEGERPAAYITILGDRRIKTNIDCDHGIAAQSILLGAVEKGLGGCIIGSVKKDALRSVLNLSGNYDILLVIALGIPKEQIQLETAGKNGNIEYWRDEQEIHHVPKRPLDEIILK